jgi:hypothetical protein
MTVFWPRALREEEVLDAEFGERWREYADRVPSGLLGLDLLRALGAGHTAPDGDARSASTG